MNLLQLLEGQRGFHDVAAGQDQSIAEVQDEERDIRVYGTFILIKPAVLEMLGQMTTECRAHRYVDIQQQ